MKELLVLPPDAPGGRKCFVCGPDNPNSLGLKFYKVDDTTVSTDMIPPDYWCGWDNLMHGGLQCVLLDEVVCWALTGLRKRLHYFTMSMDVRFIKPVRLDQTLTLVGRIQSETHTGSRVLGQIIGESGQVLSEGKAKMIHANGDRFRKIMDSLP